MRENILHFIWQHQYFSISEAYTTEGDLVQVFQQGFQNHNSGPDFEQAKLKIGEVEWNGDVEVHVNSSAWKTHGHHTDEAYNKVVLHVVWQDDGEVFRRDGTSMPTLELRGLVDTELLNRIHGLVENIESIPCSSQLNRAPKFTILETMHRALVKRLERKAIGVLQELNATQGDWSEIAYRIFSRQMGMKVNGEVFYELARLVPYQLIRKYKHDIEKVEAILFGVSGLLYSVKDDVYVAHLKKEFNFLAHKHNITNHLQPEQWKFMRLRPSNFPTLRIAQLAAILANPVDVFELLTEFKEADELTKSLKVGTSPYWQTHYRFGTESKQKVPSFGKTSIDLILLNVVAPLLAAYSLHISDNRYMEKAIFITEQLKPENNRIIKSWEELDIRPKNGAESQGLIELYNEHCQKKACLTCGIGYKLLNTL